MAMGKLVQYSKTTTVKRGRKRVRKNMRASKVLKKVIQKEINKNLETKEYVSDINPSGLIDSTAEVLPSSIGILPSVRIGDDNQTRSGDQILVKSISGKFRCTSITTATSAILYLIKFKQSDGRSLTVSDIWTGTSDIAIGMRKDENIGDYQILARVDIKVGPGGLSNRVFSFSKSFKGAGLKVQYDADTGLVTDVEKNNLFFVAQSNVSDDVITLVGQYRLRYKDA